MKNKPHPRWVQSGINDANEKNSSAGAKSSIPSSPRPQKCSSPDGSNSSSPSTSSLHLLPPTSSSSRMSPLDTTMSGSSSSSSSSYNSPSPLDTPSPLTLTPVEVAGDGGYDLASLLSSCYSEGGLEGALESIFDGFIQTDGLSSLSGPDPCLMHHDHTHIDGHCGCLGDASSYNVVLELSLRLRRAAETLGHFSKHQSSSSCPIHQRIADLDRYTTYVL